MFHLGLNMCVPTIYTMYIILYISSLGGFLKILFIYFLETVSSFLILHISPISHSLPISCSLHLSLQVTWGFYNTLEVYSLSPIVHLSHIEGGKNKSTSFGSCLSSVNSDLNSLLLLHAP